ncbi:tellurite resistance TerB family protein [Methylobacterium sp. ID0610]|uniref:tellurite resistance TerB family protein n=1 Tax=Methylobacterium carpenticola TaxID=3344827 RepID=UPI0036CB59C6
MGLFQDTFTRIGRVVMSYAGDTAFLHAAASGAANVILADREIDEDEIETALTNLAANPILHKSYGVLKLEQELHEAIARAKSRAGRIENLRFLSAIADRPLEQRQDVFLIAADVADQGGISELENKVLDEVAEALGVDKAALLSA